MRLDSKMSKQLYYRDFTLWFTAALMAVLMIDKREPLIQQRKQYITS
jgi:hypothetical protein